MYANLYSFLVTTPSHLPKNSRISYGYFIHLFCRFLSLKYPPNKKAKSYIQNGWVIIFSSLNFKSGTFKPTFIFIFLNNSIDICAPYVNYSIR